MIKVSNNFTQGSKEWLTFRGTGLGASDAPIIMGKSPWATRFELWAQKTKMLSPPEPHVMAAVAMKRGTDLEPEARRLYNAATGLQSEPINLEHPEHSFIRASLDGLSKDGLVVLEVKTPGKKDLEDASKGKIPKKYHWQLVQQLMLVPKATHLDYVTYDGKKKIYITKFDRNTDDEATLLKELISFWNLVDASVPPVITYLDVNKVIKRLREEHARVTSSISALTLISSLIINKQFADLVFDKDGIINRP